MNIPSRLKEYITKRYSPEVGLWACYDIVFEGREDIQCTLSLWSDMRLCLVLYGTDGEAASGVENYTIHNMSGVIIGSFDEHSQAIVESSSVVEGFEIRNLQGDVLNGTLYAVVKTIPHIIA